MTDRIAGGADAGALGAIKALCLMGYNPSGSEEGSAILRRWGRVEEVALVYNRLRELWGYAEALDGVREALGQESIHYLTVAGDVSEAIRVAGER